VSAPRWSVVVPAYDRPARLSECLAALAALARGEHLAFTDDDCRPASGWLRAGLSQVATAAGFAGARLRAGRGTGTR
jgi:hypothetical protein